MSWRYHEDGDVSHIWPVNDLIEHEADDDGACPCGPCMTPVSVDGNNGWLITHHSLDGRERQEPGLFP